MMKNVIGLSLLCSILINAVLFYRIFDLGVTLTHQADEIHYREQQTSDLKKLLPLLFKSTSRDQILRAGNQAGLEVIEKTGEGTYVGTVFFSYSKDKVTAVDLQ